MTKNLNYHAVKAQLDDPRQPRGLAVCLDNIFYAISEEGYSLAMKSIAVDVHLDPAPPEHDTCRSCYCACCGSAFTPNSMAERCATAVVRSHHPVPGHHGASATICLGRMIDEFKFSGALLTDWLVGHVFGPHATEWIEVEEDLINVDPCITRWAQRYLASEANRPELSS